MTPTFTLLHTESVNMNMDSVCHIILIPVINGKPRDIIEYFLNPETDFDLVTSGITESEVESFSKYKDEWRELQMDLMATPWIVSSADGYSARALHGTLERLGIHYHDMRYCNAKAICRKTYDEISYSLNYLADKFGYDGLEDTDPIGIAKFWTEMVVNGLSCVDSPDLATFLEDVKILPGLISSKGLVPSRIKKENKYKAPHHLDTDAIEITPQEDNPFFESTVVFTGKLNSLTRDQARTSVISIGGFSPDTLTKATNYLVVGAQDLRVVGAKGLSGKMKKAADYKAKGADIEIIDENDFIDMIGAENLKK